MPDNSSSIITLLTLRPDLLAQLFGPGADTGGGPAPPSLTDISTIGDSSTRLIYSAYQSVLRRDPTEGEVSKWLADSFNPGAQCTIAERMGIAHPKDCRKANWFVPSEQMQVWLTDRVRESAGPEELQQAQLQQEIAGSEVANRNLKLGLIRGLVGELTGQKKKGRGIPTLAREQFEEAKKTGRLGVNIGLGQQGLGGLSSLSQIYGQFPQIANQAFGLEAQQGVSFLDLLRSITGIAQGVGGLSGLSNLFGGGSGGSSGTP